MKSAERKPVNDLGKKMLSEFLGFLKYKVDNESMTLDEMSGLLEMFEDSVHLRATIEDLARYYGKSEVAVRSVIHRNLMPNPRRRVMYDFQAFNKIAPEKWKK